MIWFLRDRSFDVIEAADKLERTLMFRQQMRPASISADEVTSRNR